MFTHTLSRTAVGALLAAMLLVPAAQADDWARDQRMTIDPAIVSAIHDRASLQPEPVATRPDDRAGTRGVGTLPQPAQVAASDSFDLNRVGVGLGAALAALLVGLGLLLAVRHAPTRATST